MIDTTILACTALCELSLLAGYTLALWEQFLCTGRQMVIAFVEALG